MFRIEPKSKCDPSKRGFDPDYETYCVDRFRMNKVARRIRVVTINIPDRLEALRRLRLIMRRRPDFNLRVEEERTIR